MGTVSALWHDSHMPSWAGGIISYSFHDLPEIHVEAPYAYQAAMEDMRIREQMLGAGWFKHNADLAHLFYEMKKAWWA